MSQGEELAFSLSDILETIRRNKQKLFLCTLCFSLLFVTFRLNRPVLYTAEALFRDRASARNSERGVGSLAGLLSEAYGGGKGEDLSSVMLSRRILEKAIERTNLHARLKEETFLPPIAQRIYGNLQAEWQNLVYLLLKKVPRLEEKQAELLLSEVKYFLPWKSSFSLTLHRDGRFTLFQKESQFSAEGTLGIPFTCPYVSFLLKSNGHPPSHTRYTLAMTPLSLAADEIEKKVSVIKDRKDWSLYKVGYADEERERSAFFVNALMEEYQNYLKDESAVVAEQQLHFLQSQQKATQKNLEQVLDEYATGLEFDVTSSGFPSSEKELSVLGEAQQQCQRNLFAIELNMKRLGTTGETGVSLSEFPKIAGLENVIDGLKKQKDELNITFGKEAYPFDEKQFAAIFNEFEKIKEKQRTIKNYLATLEGAQDEKLLFQRRALIGYLRNLENTLFIKQQTLTENLPSVEDFGQQMQGVTLEMAKELYLGGSRELRALETEEKEVLYFLEKVKDLKFELSSFSGIKIDPFSQKAIEKAAALEYLLKDETSRSAKEQERVRAELSMQRELLELHLTQTLDLLKIKQEALQEKLESLRKIKLHLISHQISLTERQKQDLVQLLTASLQSEKEAISKQMEDVKEKMAAVPKKWVAEQMLKHAVSFAEKMTEEITKLVEVKTINYNLDVIQSRPVDFALMAFLPSPPHLLVFGVLGAILGWGAAFGYFLVRSVMYGFFVTPESLRVLNKHVAGKISKFSEVCSLESISDSDLETLRNLFAFEQRQEEASRKWLLLEGSGPKYAPLLAAYIAKMGLRVLLVPLSFTKEGLGRGLLQHLQGETDNVLIERVERGYDQVEAGGVCRYAAELVSSSKFLTLLADWEREYDWILLTSESAGGSGEASSLLNLFDRVTCTVHDDTFQTLSPLLEITGKRTSFLFA